VPHTAFQSAGVAGVQAFMDDVPIECRPEPSHSSQASGPHTNHPNATARLFIPAKKGPQWSSRPGAEEFAPVPGTGSLAAGVGRTDSATSLHRERASPIKVGLSLHCNRE